MMRAAASNFDFVGAVDEIICAEMEEVSRRSQPPLSEAQEQAMKEDLITGAQEVRRAAERLQRLSPATISSESKQFSTVLSEIVVECESGNLSESAMKPAHVAFLKELQEKLAFWGTWGTWQETKKEWDSLSKKWIDALRQKYPNGVSGIVLEAMTDVPAMKFDLVGAVDEVIRAEMEEVSRRSQPPLSEAQEQAMKEDLITSAQEVRRAAERLQRLSPPSLFSEAKQLSTTMSGVLEELDGSGKAST